LLHEEERRADVNRKHAVELLDRLVLNRGLGGDSRIGDENIQPIADKLADFGCEFVGAIGRGKIGADRIGVSSGRADFGDERFRLFAGVAVVNDDACAGGGKRAGCRAADATRCAGDKCGSADKVGHGRSPVGVRKLFE